MRLTHTGELEAAQAAWSSDHRRRHRGRRRRIGPAGQCRILDGPRRWLRRRAVRVPGGIPTGASRCSHRCSAATAALQLPMLCSLLRVTCSNPVLQVRLALAALEPTRLRLWAVCALVPAVQPARLVGAHRPARPQRGDRRAAHELVGHDDHVLEQHGRVAGMLSLHGRQTRGRLAARLLAESSLAVPPHLLTLRTPADPTRLTPARLIPPCACTPGGSHVPGGQDPRPLVQLGRVEASLRRGAGERKPPRAISRASHLTLHALSLLSQPSRACNL